MSNPIISRLQSEYLTLVNREADWAVRYGQNHTAVVNLTRQIRDIRKSIHDELGRIEQTFKSELEIAKKRQDEVEQSMGSLISQSTKTNQAQVTLFSLDAAAKSYRKLYDSFLQQYTEAVQQQTFPISNARSLSSASAIQTGPQSPSRVDVGGSWRWHARGGRGAFPGSHGSQIPDQRARTVLAGYRVSHLGPVVA